MLILDVATFKDNMALVLAIRIAFGQFGILFNAYILGRLSLIKSREITN